MMRLTAQQRRILELITINSGITTKDIAKALNTTPESIKVQIHHLRNGMAGTGSQIAFGYILRSET